MSAKSTSLYLPGDLIEARFRIDRLLGTGGMGEVYLADDLGTGRRVALKMLLPELLGNEKSQARFEREIETTQAIDHPNVLTIYELLKLTPPQRRPKGPPIPCLVMEYLEGQSLADHLENEGPLENEEARSVVLQMARALDAAHQRGVVHRDLKPDNVFLVPEEGATLPRVVLTDFGVARRSASRSDDGELSGDSLTASNVVIGTPEFMAPELLELEEAIPASDQYAMGLVAFEMVTGTRPFDGEKPLRALFKRVNEPAPSPLERRPDLDPLLARVIERALERQPEDRFASASDIVRLLTHGKESWRLQLPALNQAHLITLGVGLAMVTMVVLLVWLYAQPAS